MHAAGCSVSASVAQTAARNTSAPPTRSASRPPPLTPPALPTREVLPAVRALAEAAPPGASGDNGTFSKISHTPDGKRLQVHAVDIAADTVALRSLDWDRARFDIEFALTEGTTYNAYLIFGESHTALVDASHEKFRDAWLPVLQATLNARGRTLDYLIVSHTEPDHSGLAGDVLRANPGCVAVGSKVALQFLAGLNPDFELPQRAVKGGDVIELGGDHSLEFVLAPNLHWPDTMFSFDKATGVLYTCDAFGSHLCQTDPYDKNVGDIMPHYEYYYDCLMRPNAKSVTTALRKLNQAGITEQLDTIATGHGPILRYNREELVRQYQTWSEATAAKTTTVLVLYTGDYGYADRLSQTLARGVTKAGCQTEMLDLAMVDPQELLACVGRAQGVVLLSPPEKSANCTSARSVLLSAVDKKQKVLIAESFGGDDVPVDSLTRDFVAVNVEPVLAPLRIRSTPDTATYQAFEEAGTDLAQMLFQKERIAQLKEGLASDVAKALARVSGGLYVVTAANVGGARSAMIASWVSQASFEPLGLSIAVAKDRAIESLMQVGDAFVLNVLGEEGAGPTMKHFLKRFAPGEDRFEGVALMETAAVPHAPAPVLAAGIAHLSCRVVSRMDAGDHWIMYASVADGDVTNADVETAVHRRKVASYY